MDDLLTFILWTPTDKSYDQVVSVLADWDVCWANGRGMKDYSPQGAHVGYIRVRMVRRDIWARDAPRQETVAEATWGAADDLSPPDVLLPKDTVYCNAPYEKFEERMALYRLAE